MKSPGICCLKNVLHKMFCSSRDWKQFKSSNSQISFIVQSFYSTLSGSVLQTFLLKKLSAGKSWNVTLLSYKLRLTDSAQFLLKSLHESDVNKMSKNGHRKTLNITGIPTKWHSAFEKNLDLRNHKLALIFVTIYWHLRIRILKPLILSAWIITKGVKRSTWKPSRAHKIPASLV